jgi:hypothetical protein
MSDASMCGPEAAAGHQLHAECGYAKLFVGYVLQADPGADFEFLVGRTGSPVPRDN